MGGRRCECGSKKKKEKKCEGKNEERGKVK
jgi:hypothetical protein